MNLTSIMITTLAVAAIGGVQDPVDPPPEVDASPESHSIALTLVEIEEPWLGRGIPFEGESGKFDRYSGEPVLVEPGESIDTRLLSGHPIRATRSDDGSGAYFLRIDRDNDGELDTGDPVRIEPNTTIRLRLDCRQGEETFALPFEICFNKAVEEHRIQVGDQEAVVPPSEYFTMRSLFQYEGRLVIDGHRADVKVFDTNLDGVFNESDFFSGSALGIMPPEGAPAIMVMGEQLFSFAGRFLYADVAGFPDNASSITLIRSAIPIPVVGEPLPAAFALAMADGTFIELQHLFGHVTLIDFWASWCAPCIKTISEIQPLEEEFGDALQVFYFSHDEQRGVPAARRIMGQYKLPDSRVALSGEGKQDPFYKMVGSMKECRFGNSLQVIFDRNGVVRYASMMGDVEEVRGAIEELLAASD